MLAHAKGMATHRHHDSRMGCDVVKLLPNEYYVTDEDIVLSTVLGSCVAACIGDPVTRIGGMNHFMLPGSEESSAAGMSMRYGAYAMEILINELLKMGARRERLEAKVFGGGAVIERMQQMNIGQRNADFVLDYLQTEQIPVLARDLCGDHARRVHYMPRSGKVLLKRMASPRTQSVVARREEELRAATPEIVASKPKVEMFAPRPKGERSLHPAIEFFTPVRKESR